MEDNEIASYMRWEEVSDHGLKREERYKYRKTKLYDLGYKNCSNTAEEY